jgi:acylphosphatase
MKSLSRFPLSLLLIGGLAAAGRAAENLTIDEKAKTVTVSAAFARQGIYDELKGAIEYVVVSKAGKEYETIFVADATAEQVYDALLKIGLTPGEPAKDNDPPKGKPVRVLAEYKVDGKKLRRPIDEFVAYMKTDKPLDPAPWVFTGSTQGFDPATNKEVLQAALSKSIVGLHFQDSSPLLQNPRPEAKEANIYKANAKELPKPGTPARLIFERVAAQVAEGTRRVHLFISGQVQGVGFREFTQREARQLGLTGFVKNLPDGRVEAVIEGPADKLVALLEKLKRGPRAARVDKLDQKDEPAEGEFETFEVRF